MPTYLLIFLTLLTFVLFCASPPLPPFYYILMDLRTSILVFREPGKREILVGGGAGAVGMYVYVCM